MQNIPIAIKFQHIRMHQKGAIPKNERVMAAHLVTDYYKVSEARSAIKKIYDKPGEWGYPMAVIMRFVPI